MNEIEHGEDWRSKVGGSPGQLSDDLTRAREPGRGRDANTPRDIPARGWNDILWRVFWSVSEDRVLSTSGGAAFFALLAIFPAIATMVSLYGLIADSGTIRGHLSLLAGILPGGVLELLGHQISLISTQDTDMFSSHSWWDLSWRYVANFDSYNKTYGSFGAGAGFMVWIWLSVVIVLLGAELNAEMEHQTVKDSTEGPSKPLGNRGAHMADHVGESHA